jgi:hypothetical protein
MSGKGRVVQLGATLLGDSVLVLLLLAATAAAGHG